MNAPRSDLQVRALRKILGGDDADMADLTMRELRAQKNIYEDLIVELSQVEDAKVQTRARLILRFWENMKRRDRASETEPLEFSSWEDLESFCWQLAEIESPGIDLQPGMSYLDKLGALVEKNLPQRSISPSDSIGALRQVLARREGFRGNLENYFAPANSYLHRVLETKLGIPLALGLVYIFAGQRAGLEVYGLNTPGHYLVGIGGVTFDPFHGAAVMSADDLSAKFGTERGCWASPMYMRATPRETAERMLVNLVNSYSRAGDEARHARVVSYLQMVEESFG